MILRLEQVDPQWVRLRGCARQLLTFIRHGMKANYRRFNTTEAAWEVHHTTLGNLGAAALNYQSGIDYSTLPEEWRSRFTGVKFEGSATSVQNVSPYEVLHLTSDAPIELVRAAYKTLSFLHHPDRGGNPQRLQAISDAYRKVLTIRRTDAV